MAGHDNGRAKQAPGGETTLGPAAYPATLRLKKPLEFSRVFQRNTRSKDRYFTVLGRHNRRGTARLGLAVSKKACKKAVGRNRIKRIIRESFRQQRCCLPDLDLVVMSKAAATEATGPRLSASLANHWQEMMNKCAR